MKEKLKIFESKEKIFSSVSYSRALIGQDSDSCETLRSRQIFAPSLHPTYFLILSAPTIHRDASLLKKDAGYDEIAMYTVYTFGSCRLSPSPTPKTTESADHFDFIASFEYFRRFSIFGNRGFIRYNGLLSRFFLHTGSL